MSDLPIVMTEQGPITTAPADLRNQLVTLVAATSPGYTSNLPGTLIEDIASTDVGALVICDQAAAELVNSITPFGANEFLLTQLGNIYGVQLGSATNTSVDVEFTAIDANSNPLAGYVIQPGFTVGDGTYQYVVQDGGVTGADGITGNLFCVATQSGTWAVPANSVTQLVTSVPSDVTLTVTNPLPGVPGAAAEDAAAFRSRVLQAGLAASLGMPRYLKTLLEQVPGVQARLVSVRQQPGGWEIIVGGGDQYQVALAIFDAVTDVTRLTGSVMAIDAITQTNPGQVTTVLNHGLVNGQVINITGVVGMVQINNMPLTITVVDEKNFTVGTNTGAFSPYVSGGVVSPNPRNVVVTINDYPDTYQIPFVLPPQQTVEIVCTWNTSLTNFVAAAAIAQLATPAIVAYINSIQVGQPIILYVLESTFQTAVADVLPPQFLTRMVFAVSINGVGVSPEAGTGIIAGDPESFFFATTASVSVQQG